MNKYKRAILFAFSFYIPLCEGGQIEPQSYRAAWAYVDYCCFVLSKELFKEILHDNVALFHQTNEESPFVAQGREIVSELFSKYIFENSLDIELKGVDIRACENGISLKLLVEETKISNGDMYDRFLFEENTIFHFNEAFPGKIISMQTTVKRLSIF